jgi:hypothetical protein
MLVINDAERWINLHQIVRVKIHNIYLFIKRLEVIMAFSKMIKPGLALVLFGSSGLAINDQTGVLPDTIYNLIFIGLFGLGSILFIIGCCKVDTS